ncbi:MAG: hypothetical protein ACKOQN_11655 [Dolichospermum sp.]
MTREQGTLNREQVLGNFTFCYLCRFFSAHLLTHIQTLDIQQFPIFRNYRCYSDFQSYKVHLSPLIALPSISPLRREESGSCSGFDDNLL